MKSKLRLVSPYEYLFNSYLALGWSGPFNLWLVLPQDFDSLFGMLGNANV